eukprot:8132426-Lingulodinium_polyedra.AAC.1
MLEAWHQKNIGIQVSACKKITTQGGKVSTCFVAGRCLCSSENGKQTAKFVKAFAAALCGKDGILKKGSHGRKLYENGLPVIRTFRKRKSQNLLSKDCWVHLSF